MAKNSRLKKLLEPAIVKARKTACTAGGFAGQFNSFHYQMAKAWSCSGRIIGKVQIICGKEKPGFIVTNLPEDQWAAEEPHTTKVTDFSLEGTCRARSDMENRIKEQLLDIFADRTSSVTMASNQLRLWFSTIAGLLVQQLRIHALAETKLAKATAGTIRQRLLKVAACIRVSVQRATCNVCTCEYVAPSCYGRSSSKLTSE